MESATKQADQLSPFIWSDAVETSKSKEKKSNDEIEGNVDQGDELGGPDYKAIHYSRRWTSERIWKIMQEQSEKWLGVRLNISTIGISRQYLHGKFVVDKQTRKLIRLAQHKAEQNLAHF